MLILLVVNVIFTCISLATGDYNMAAINVCAAGICYIAIDSSKGSK